MNHFEVKESQPNDFHKPHLCIFIDEERLDLWLAKRTGMKKIAGLVPTALPWSPVPAERVLVWGRLLSDDVQPQPCPVLMCPDDLDFTCDLIVVNINKQDGCVYWSKFSQGFDEAEISQESSQLLDVSTTLVFNALQYERELLKFKSEDDMWQDSES